jgi:hypothetical protein
MSGDLSRGISINITSQSWPIVELSVPCSDIACVVSGDKVSPAAKNIRRIELPALIFIT